MQRVIILAFLITTVNAGKFCGFVPSDYTWLLQPEALRIVNISRNYKDAQDACAPIGGSLANIDTKEKLDVIYKCHLKTHNRNVQLWTAARNHHGEWLWENGDLVRGKWCSSNQAEWDDNVVYSRIDNEAGCFRREYSTSLQTVLCEYNPQVASKRYKERDEARKIYRAEWEKRGGK